ncbi:MAG: MCE family protein, partial [Mycobacteriales bacterium]
ARQPAHRWCAMSRRTRLAGGVAAAAALLVTTTGCGFHGLYSANLPGSVGGPFSGDKTYDVTAWFYDAPNGVEGGVLDLVPQSSVRVNDVVVGTVESIALDGSRDLPGSTPPKKVYAAKVTMKVKTSVVLPKNTSAVLEETSLLGEKFVELDRPAHPDMSRTLAQTHVITSSTSDYPGVEQVFGVLSTVLNGGGLEKLQTINTELAAALTGREGQVHDVLTQLDSFVSGLNGVRTQIAGAITSLDALATELNKQDATIATALDDLGPGLKVLADQRAQLVSLLQGLSNLGVITHKVVDSSVDATAKDLQLLEPVLTQLNKAGKALPRALDIIPDFPFPANSVTGINGDGNNLILDVNATSILNSISGVCTTPGGVPAAVSQACTDLANKLASVLGSLGIGSLPLGAKGQAVRPATPLSGLLAGGAQ